MAAGTYETCEISRKENPALNFLYNSLPGRALLHVLIRPPVSGFFGLLMDLPASRVFIRGFARRNKVNMNDYKDVAYTSFNDFFTREIKKELRPFPDDAYDLAAPCDGKLTAYPIEAGSVFRIKDSVYDLEGLLADEALARAFAGGVCLIFRLTPDDYHRYSYIDDGEILRWKRIKGVLHTVRPISSGRYKVYGQNSREYTVMQTKNFGKIIQMEVGALFVGRISNHMTQGSFHRGDEKGRFEFGGSTVVMLFREGAVAIDEAVCRNTRQNKETIVRMGEAIGKKTTRERGRTL